MATSQAILPRGHDNRFDCFDDNLRTRLDVFPPHAIQGSKIDALYVNSKIRLQYDLRHGHTPVLCRSCPEGYVSPS